MLAVKKMVFEAHKTGTMHLSFSILRSLKISGSDKETNKEREKGHKSAAEKKGN